MCLGCGIEPLTFFWAPLLTLAEVVIPLMVALVGGWRLWRRHISPRSFAVRYLLMGCTGGFVVVLLLKTVILDGFGRRLVLRE